VQDGSVRVINTDTVVHQPTQAPKEAAYKRGPETTLSTKIPDYVMRQFKITAAEKGTTIRNLLLDALKKDGFDIGGRRHPGRPQASVNRDFTISLNPGFKRQPIRQGLPASTPVQGEVP
jgi:hypothetical protein